jgi:hypothetical protein
VVRRGHEAALRRAPCAGARLSRRSAGACPATPTLERMYTLRSAAIQEAEPIAGFMEHVIATSVEASPDEKAAFVANTRKNLKIWVAALRRAFSTRLSPTQRIPQRPGFLHAHGIFGRAGGLPST